MDGEHPEWLPVDWKVCVRVRVSGKKDKYYVNPSNDRKFNSKPEVLRYLQNAEKDLKLRKLNKVDTEKGVAERLPSGWIKETRITRKGGKTRRNLCYIDPVDGRHFSSLQEVKRYLETKNSGKAECNEDNSDHPSEELGDHYISPTARAEGFKLIDEKVDETPSGNVKSGAAVENINPPETDASGQIRKEDDSKAEDQQQEKKRKKHSKWMNGLPRRSSKRLARVEADPPLEVKSCSRAAGARLSDKAGVDTKEAIEKSKLSGKTEVIITSENFDKQEKASTSSPLGDLSSAEDHECASADLKEDEKNDKNINSSLNNLFMDPCIEFAIKTLTGAIPLQDVNKILDGPVASPAQASTSSSVPPSSDIWADPCFEFAVKTLTSEIPMEDDGSHFQISFKQPLSSSGATGCNTTVK
ncbi:hypothetical protein C2S52_015668 [Perilla frutescens var. hirtella]|nr:hypothetical protein C2S52_015668 [Perilla frutescens var. hirtella]